MMPCRGTVPDVVSFNVAMSACLKGQEWSAALVLFEQICEINFTPDVFSYSTAIAASSKSGDWTCAVALLDDMQRKAVQPNSITFSAAISACEKNEEWPWALELFGRLVQSGLQADLIAWNAAISACGRAGAWPEALWLLGGMRLAHVLPDVITYGAAISACETGKLWQRALELLAEIPRRRLEPNAVTCSAAISACRQGSQWECAVVLLGQMIAEGPKPNAIAYNAVISACDRGAAWRVAICLVDEMWKCSIPRTAVTYSSAISVCYKQGEWQLSFALFASMQRERLEVSAVTCSTLLSACDVAGREEQAVKFLRSVEHFKAADCAYLSWAFAKFQVHSVDVLRRIAEEVVINVKRIKLELLSDVAWAFATLQEPSTLLFRQIAAEIASRLDAVGLQRGAALQPTTVTTRDVMRVVWALNFAGVECHALLHKARALMLRIGRGLDEAVEQELLSVAGSKAPRILPLVPTGEHIRAHFGAVADVHVQVDLPDRFVIQKEPDWEVDSAAAAGTGWPLSSFVRALHPPRLWRILGDAGHRHGFLHRLDVPSSGLVLVAKTYTAYFDLQLQLCEGCMVRDYTVLCHGWMPPTRRRITSRLHFDKIESLGVIKARGKPAETAVDVLAHVALKEGAFSLMAIRIRTGRTHQIRVHTAHVACPTVCDGKYTALPVWRSDSRWCARNFLHRHRLLFRGSTGNVVEAVVPLSRDLAHVLAQARPRSGKSGDVVQSLLDKVLLPAVQNA